MGKNDQENAIMAEIEVEGYDDAIQGAGIDANPYLRGTKEFTVWRAGWAYGNHALWQGIQMDKRKSSTE